MGRQRHHHDQCQERRQPVQNVQQVFSLLYQPVPLLPSERVRIALFVLGDLADPRIEKARQSLAAYHYENEAAVARLMNDARRNGAEHQDESCPI
jgi:hypothetical protein